MAGHQHELWIYFAVFDLRPLQLLIKDKTLFILELTVGIETNIDSTTVRKEAKYKERFWKLYSIKL